MVSQETVEVDIPSSQVQLLDARSVQDLRMFIVSVALKLGVQFPKDSINEFPLCLGFTVGINQHRTN